MFGKASEKIIVYEEALKDKEKDCADAHTLYETDYKEFMTSEAAGRRSLADIVRQLKEVELKKSEVVKDNLRKFVIFDSRYSGITSLILPFCKN